MKNECFKSVMSLVHVRCLLTAILCVIASTLYACEVDIAQLRNKAEQGLASAQFKLAIMYATGEGVTKDAGEAVKWFRKAAEQGLAGAQSSLGFMYATGEGVRKDAGEAVKWYRKAAEQGEASAQYNLGLAYAEGEGVRKDAVEAVKWFRKAAEQGLAGAQFGLGFMYDTGEGVTKDAGEAVKWFRKAAEQGLAGAQFGLGFMYDTGEGVPKNSVESYKWLNLASAAGEERAAKARTALESEMTPGQIAEAQRLSANWQPKSSSDSEKSRNVPGQSKQPSKPPKKEPQIQAGTGFVVSREGHVLTNYHVIEGCTKIVCDLGGKPTLLSVVQTDTRNDLALLRLNNPGPAALKFRDGKSIRSGDGIVVVGYPLQEILANQAHVTTGTISAMAGPANDARILQITAPVQAGNSGAPVLDLAGNVVGIATAKLNAIKTAQRTGDLPQNVNFAINAAVVKAFLDANGVGYESASSNKKLEASEIGESAKKSTLFILCSKE
jgi:uncharacterized protein